MENYLVGKLRGAEPPKGRALALRSPLPGRLAQHPSLPGGPRLGASSFGTATHTQRLFRNAYFLVFVLFCFANFVIIASLYEQTQLLRGVVAWLRRPMSQKNRPRAGRRRPAPRSGFSNPAGRAVVQWPRPAPPWAAARRPRCSCPARAPMPRGKLLFSSSHASAGRGRPAFARSGGRV